MHELSISQAIVKTVLRYAEVHDARHVSSMEIELGELTSFNKEQVAFWTQIGFENTLAQKARVIFIEIKGRIRCENCGYEGELNLKPDSAYHYGIPDFTCPQCQKGPVKIIQGKEAIIRRIKILK